MKASHKPHKQMVGFQEVFLSPGQFIFGRKAASIELAMTERGVRTCIESLSKSQNVTIKTTNKFSIITIINWDTYQEEKEKTTIKTTNNRPTTDQQLTTNKNDKNEKNEKNKPLPLKKFLISRIQNGFTPHSEKIIEFFEYRMKKPKKDRYQSEKGIDGLFRDMEACKKAGYSLVACLDITMERGWKTPSPEYFDKIKTLVCETISSRPPQRPIEDDFK